MKHALTVLGWVSWLWPVLAPGAIDGTGYESLRRAFAAPGGYVPAASAVSLRSPVMAYGGRCFTAEEPLRAKAAILTAFQVGNELRFYVYSSKDLPVAYYDNQLWDQPGDPRMIPVYAELEPARPGPGPSLVARIPGKGIEARLKVAGGRFVAHVVTRLVAPASTRETYCGFGNRVIRKSSEVWLTSQSYRCGRDWCAYVGWFDRENGAWVPGQGSYELISFARRAPRDDDSSSSSFPPSLPPAMTGGIPGLPPGSSFHIWPPPAAPIIQP